ncbi:hypothetical protein CMV_005700 [Castanea mollissima]|uniref:non-specific serine/threonine protein kinase n=1 Tax=Castanea mollissima TaxID=60419 RepID=A0A8J4RQ94_9ROSI|nr:hypothetical protein CMV_005700 [Castanea mollissima]
MAEQSVQQTTSNLNPPRNILFGKYEMGRVLGQGTFAKVYYGKNLISDESVAIKVINKDHIKREGLMEQIKREISVMRLVRHPNIVELKEVMATKGKIYFVMEYVKGGELFAKVAKGKLKEDLARKYFQQLVSAVDFCHSRGVSHRDLKPENLLLDDNKDLKVSDFGLSAMPEQLWNDGFLHTRCGTPAYVAPEVLRKKGKVFKAEYDFPPWFSTDAKRLISKLLVSDPEKRISIPEIMQNPWFQNGFSKPIAFSIPEPVGENNDKDDDKIIEEMELEKKSSSPPFYNAFEFISSMSSGFDLSNLFEKKRKSGSMFTSKCSAAAIVAKLEAVAKRLNFSVMGVKEFKVKMHGKMEGRKGKLAVTAEVFEVAPEVAVVEFSKVKITVTNCKGRYSEGEGYSYLVR